MKKSRKSDNNSSFIQQMCFKIENFYCTGCGVVYHTDDSEQCIECPACQNATHNCQYARNQCNDCGMRVCESCIRNYPSDNVERLISRCPKCAFGKRMVKFLNAEHLISFMHQGRALFGH